MFKDPKEMDERQFRALTGLTKAAFYKLLRLFTASYKDTEWENYEKNKSKRKRKPGGGQKGRLNTMEKKMFFISSARLTTGLYYLKVYPTFDVLGYHFGLDRSKACTNVHKLMPIMLRTLEKADVLPARHFETPEELREALEGIINLFIDATERPQQRPKDSIEQKEKYSGKKKGHTVKNTVISDAGQQILFLGYTVFGSQHDYGLFKNEFDPEQDWLQGFKVWVDLGYLGMNKDYSAIEINIPHKKPSKSKANPNPELTAEQKAENREVSQMRIVVENAICRMKRFRILTDTFRNRIENFVDDVAVVAAGLANWLLRLNTAAA